MKTKYCKYCNEYKSETDFYSSQNGLVCKYHHKIINNKRKKEYRQIDENKENEKIKNQERKIRLWENSLINSSKKRNIEHNLTVSDIKEMFEKQNGLCYWFKIPLIITLDKKHPQKPSLDRLDRNIGYIKGNVVLSCYSANIGRNETNVETWEKFIDLLFNPIKEINTPNYDDLRSNVLDINNSNKDEYIIYDENLNYVITNNLREYSKQNNISINTIGSNRKKINRNIQKGLIILNKTKNESVTKRIYKLTSPNNEIFELYSLRKFCLDNNLNDSALQRLAKKQINYYKGWNCEYKTIILK